MRQTNNEIRDFINQQIQKRPEAWKFNRGSNFGIPLQRLVYQFYFDNREKFKIRIVECNENPNSTDPDIVVHYSDNKVEGIEVKSCKNGALSGVTICNSPHLLNDSKAILINYVPHPDTNVIFAENVYVTQLHRLTSKVKTGKYTGCLISTRDTGKKIKGRNFNDFINTSENDDYSIEELTDERLIRKTILYYSASKLVDDDYTFSDEEILEAIHFLRRH
ncbi:MAG: hypothetical protein MJ090_00035 [Clostridia bacterium]|nr:hypothetical protein [Clostridia bacterium]